MEPTLRSTQVLKQEAEDIGLQGKDIAEYVTRQQTLDREERAAWREAQKMQAQADIELKIKKMELQAQQAQAQATASSATTPPPRNKDAKSPNLPSFIDEKDELDSYLLRFERYAENASWEKDTWAIKLSVLLTGRAMNVDLIVKEQFINACSEDLAMYLLERGPKVLVELTMWAQKDLQIRRKRHSPNQIRHKDARGRCSATNVMVLDIGNQSVVQRLVPARTRRVRRHQ